MDCRRLASAFLALTVAYAIVLGGVLGPALSHGFDPADQYCAPGGVGAPLGAGSDRGDSPKQQSNHDCCPAVCGSAPILPSGAQVEAPLAYSPVVHEAAAQEPAKLSTTHARSARAPPGN